VLPAADDAIAVGVYPLQTVPAPGSPEQRDDGGDSTPTTYNILPIMVDQLRQPVWLPSGTGGCQTALDSICPNIALLRNPRSPSASTTAQRPPVALPARRC